MTIAADPRYRSVRLVFDNNEARGNENVQLFAKALGGEWALARTFAVAGAEQETTWDTALPVTAYEIAMRYVSGSVPAVGYEGTPDEWTAPTAAGSKSTVDTVSAAVTWVGGAFTGASNPVNLQWSSAQQDVPYLLEKDPGSGWVTVASDLVATSYQYTVPAIELDTTVQFRVTAQRGAVVGPTAGVLAVPMEIIVGQPTITSATFSDATAIVSLAWSAATATTEYIVEKNPSMAGWSTVATVSTLTYQYSILPAEANTTVQFRITGKNGVITGTPSAPASVACTMAIGVGSVDVLTFGLCGVVGAGTRQANATVTPPSGTLVSQQVEFRVNGSVYEVVTIGPAPSNDARTTCNTSIPNVAGTTISARVRGVAAGPVYGVYSAPRTIVL